MQFSLRLEQPASSSSSSSSSLSMTSSSPSGCDVGSECSTRRRRRRRSRRNRREEEEKEIGMTSSWSCHHHPIILSQQQQQQQHSSTRRLRGRHCDFPLYSSSSSSSPTTMTMKMAMLVLVAMLLCSVGVGIGVVESFNVDLPSALIHRGPQSGSYFGFSVDLHKDRGLNWLLVGAPLAQTPQPGVTRGGSVYRCSTELADQCEAIPFDVTGNNNASGQQIDQKSEQWFGATVRSAGPNGPVLACAPRYVWYSSNYKRREPVGTCFVARDSFREFSEYSPCRTSNWGYHRQGSCQAGLGASISPDGQRMFVGAVGSWYWQGQLYSINTTFPAVRSPVFRTFVTGQLFSQGLFSRLDVLSTSEGSAAEDDSYLGYSSAVGDLDDDGRTDVAVGMPRGANLTGKVVMLTSNLTNIGNLTGQQLGAYFGYCLTITDVDGDGLQDVIVGAPLYTNYANTDGKFETGRIHVFYHSVRNTYKRSDVIDGEVTKARFGLSVAALGDINLDGFNDIAVGAPYDGDSSAGGSGGGGGAVYIFHGSSKGLRSKAVQVIYASQVTSSVSSGSSSSSSLSTFGFSLAGGLDVDGNEYPDLVVGAYESDRIVYLRSRPVVQLLAADVTFDVDSKQIDLDSRNCSLLDGVTAVACVPLTLCFEYGGRGVDTRQDINVQLVLDAKSPKSPRLHFLASEGRSNLNQTFSLVKGQRFCRTHTVYVRPLIRDKLTPIEAEVRYSLNEQQPDAVRRRNRRQLAPVLGADTPTKSDVIVIQKNCGPDNVCIPDMQVTAKTNMDSYILGSGGRLEIEVSVLNAAEDAFEATVYLHLPPQVSFVKIDRAEESDATSILCSPPADDTGRVLRCDIGNPLPAFRTAVFGIHLQPIHSSLIDGGSSSSSELNSKTTSSSLDFLLEVNSTNPEEASQMFDNRLELSLPIRVQTDLFIGGKSDPEVVNFNLSAYTSSSSAGGEVKSHENQVGPQVMHIYELGNRGPSDIVQADVYILWPTKTLAGKDLLYLVDRPIIDGPANCQLMEQFNPLALKLESERLVLARQGALVGSGGSHQQHHHHHSSSSSGSSSHQRSSSSSSSSSSSRSSSSSASSAATSSSTAGSGGGTSKTTSYRYSSSSGSGVGASGSGSGAGGSRSGGGSVSSSSSIDVERAGQAVNVAATSGNRGAATGTSGGGSSSSSSWNRTSTVTRYGADGAVESSRTQQGSGSGGAGLGVGGGSHQFHQQQLATGEELGPDDYDDDYEEEEEEDLSSGGRGGFSQDDANVLQQLSSTSHGQQQRSGRHRRQNINVVNKLRARNLERELNCGAITQCTIIRCSAGPITTSNNVVFKLRARVWAQTIAEMDWKDLVISSKMVVDIRELPYGMSGGLELRTATVTTELEQLDKEREARAIPWWIIVLSAVAGVLLLLLLIFILWKLGFFKRKRPDKDTDEQEPLKSENGHLQRDEQL